MVVPCTPSHAYLCIGSAVSNDFCSGLICWSFLSVVVRFVILGFFFFFLVISGVPSVYALTCYFLYCCQYNEQNYCKHGHFCWSVIYRTLFVMGKILFFFRKELLLSYCIYYSNNVNKFVAWMLIYFLIHGQTHNIHWKTSK